MAFAQRISGRFLFLALLATSAASLAVACSGGTRSKAKNVDGGGVDATSGDATTEADAASDAAPPDVVTPDGNTDATTDSGADSGADADASADAAGDADASADAAGDADASADAAGDAGASADAAGDADAAVPPLGPYHDMQSSSFWKEYDLGSVPSGTADGHFGGTFDGRYVYFVAANGGPSLRYDTQATFNSSSSWTAFDSTAVTGTPTDYAGALFDGRYVYCVPSSMTSSVANATRFDTQGTFTSASSWSTYNTASTDSSVKGFSGGTFDGRYVYYVPNYNGSASGIVARYDTQAAFNTSSAWTSFDLKTVNGNAAGFNGAVFDGRYVYLSPDSSSTPFTRYDTQGSFTASASWETPVGAGSGFYGAAFDGRYVYYAPYSSTNVVRYDTQGSFAGGSYESFDVASVGNPGRFYGAAFDGRFVYFIPDTTAPEIIRYDTKAAFGAAASWTQFDIALLNTNAGDYGTAVFDGRYLYLMPILSGTHIIVARFDARDTPAMPALPEFHGSFY